jgi:hypothetical protein
MELSVITIGIDNPAVLVFNLRGEFAEEQLKAFDYLSLRVGDETYTTYANPEHFFIDPNNSGRLLIKIGGVTKLNEGEYPMTLLGYNLTYENGYVLNSRARPLLKPLRIKRL